MQELLALVAFSLVNAVTPGPNNVLLWASGASFGFRRTIPHIVGTALGVGGMALGVAGGLGVVVTTLPALTIAMKLGGSAYLLYLAYRIARTGSPEQGSVSRPLGVVQAAAFQAVNPKGWIFAIGAMTTFRPLDLPFVTGSLLVAVIMMAVIVPSAVVWALGGGALSRFLGGDRRRLIVSLVLGGLVAAAAVLVWL